jgi:nucleoside-diphosphate-sugar epimerase
MTHDRSTVHDGDVIVITGAAGLLGSRVVPIVRREAPAARVIAVWRTPRPGRREPGIEVVHGDLRSARVWRQLPSGVTHVIHLAAVIPWNRRHADRPSVVHDNLAPIAQLIDARPRWPGLRQIVYGSSVSVYEPSGARLRESSPTRPPSVYGAAKLAGERLLDVLDHRGIAVASLRYSSLYGAGQYEGTVLPFFADRARRGLPLELFNQARVQDFVHVDDAARGTWLACRTGAAGPFNIGGGRSVTMRALGRAVIRAFDAHGTSRIVETAGKDAGDAGLRLDIGRARRVLGYRPRITLADGLAGLARERPRGVR